MKIFIIIFILLASSLRGGAQIPVTDAANISQSIVNSVQELIQSSTTASNMVNNFKETIKIYQQGREYYTALKSVHGLVKDARKVQKTILLVGEISDLYISNFQKMLADKNYTPEELSAIAFGYARLLEESTDALGELKNVVNANGLSLSDKERFDEIDRVYNSILHLRNLTAYYTNKTLMVSWFRAKKTTEVEKFLRLYGNADEKYW